MALARYVMAILLVAGMPPGIAWWLVVHPFVGFWRGLGVRLSMWILGVSMTASAIGIVLIRDRIVGTDLGTSWPLVALSGVLMSGAALIAIKRKRHLTNRILAGVPEIANDGTGVLLTQGPYSVIRHPRYVEVMLVVLAYAFFANYVGAYVVAAVTLPALHIIVVLEERELEQRFGAEWSEWASRVPRYVPRFGAPKSASTTSHT